MSEPDDKHPLTLEQALEALEVVAGHVHTFVQGDSGAGTLVLLGADWSLEHVREQFTKHGAETAGPAALAMKHGVACRVPVYGPVFYRTREDWAPPERPGSSGDPTIV